MKPVPANRRNRSFTLVEVMMAALILVVGFMGMIEAVTVTSAMMDTARRQTLAGQIMNHEIEKLRFSSWTTITGLATASTPAAIDCLFWPTWSGASSYGPNSVVTYNGAWYRCLLAHSNQVPPNATYWTPVASGLITDIVTASGATYTLSRSVADLTTNLREVTFTVTWVVTTSRHKSDGTSLTFTYTRANSAYFGKYGLNLSDQRS